MGAAKLEDLPHYTYADYLLWKGKWEVIHGIPYAMAPAPVVTHQYVSQKIARQLDELLDDCPDCHPLLPVDLVLADDTVVQPDNLVVCTPELETMKITVVPALVFEVLSPSTAAKDKKLKFQLYQNHGVPYYCMVDPDAKTMEVYRLENGRYQAMKEENGGFPFLLEDCEIFFRTEKIFPR